MITFTVVGTPAQQGTKVPMHHRSTGKIVMFEQNAPAQKSWRKAVVEVAREHTDDALLDGPVCVWIEFHLKRPKVKKRQHWAPSRPDIDKLARNVLDALTDSGLIRDDAQVCRLNVEKRYADTADPWTGAVVSVTQLCEVH
jgi:crossover junction endodeoxyribonuclease RusA